MGSNPDSAAPLTRRRLLTLAAAVTAVPSPTFAAPVMEEAFVPIGGVEQWVAIRGRDRSRTPLLFLHGGPCEAESPFLSAFAPWEERYVVAQWDQRGTGRSFGKSGTPPNMTMAQLTQDAIQVTQYVLSRTKARKLILVGFSWGAELGLNVIRAKPELFHAFVGTGQPILGVDIFETRRATAVTHAQAAGDAQAAAQLKQMTPSDFADMAKLKAYFKWSGVPFANPGPDWDYIGRMFSMLGTPDKPKSAAAADFFAANPRPDVPETNPVCLQKLMPYTIEFDAHAGGDLQVPYFVIQGRSDPICSPEAARAFVEQVRAPVKNFTAIDGGHFVCMSNSTGFLDALDSDMQRVGKLR